MFHTILKREYIQDCLILHRPTSVVVCSPWPDLSAHMIHPRYGRVRARPKIEIGDLELALVQGLAKETPTGSRCPHRKFFGINKYLFDNFLMPTARYLQRIPFDYLVLLKDVKFHKWDLLSLFSRYGEQVVDIFSSTPVLAWLLTYGSIIKQDCKEEYHTELGRLLRRSPNQRDVLEWLGLEGSKSMIKILRKLDIRDFDFITCKLLKRAIRNSEHLKFLRHSEILDKPVLGFLLDEVYFSASFLTEIQQLEAYWRKSLYFSWLNYKETTSQCLPSRISRLIDLEILVEAEQDQQCLFPSPDFELPENYPCIRWIDNSHELRKAGVQMDNCLQYTEDYARQAMRGEKYFFIIDTTKPVVFSIFRSADLQRFVIDEISSVHNSDPESEALKIAFQWLSELNASLYQRLK